MPSFCPTRVNRPLLVGLLALLPHPVAVQAASPVARLADAVPGKTRLYLEITNPAAVVDSPLARLLDQIGRLGGPVSRPAAGTQPASAPSEGIPNLSGALKGLLTEAVGFPDTRAADLLLGSPVALAADGWSGLADAILVAEPTDLAALESLLADLRVASPEGGGGLRRYTLANQHELATDGKRVVLGMASSRPGFYHDAVRMWRGDDAVSLQDTHEFAECASRLPWRGDAVLYVGGTGRGPAGSLALGPWWPAGWPLMRSLALVVKSTDTGLQLHASGRRAMDRPERLNPSLATSGVRYLPHSTVLAWTADLNYAELMRELQSDPMPTFWTTLIRDLSARELEQRLLRHLIGQTLFIIARAESPHATTQPDGDPLVLPVLALIVETDDPHAVEQMTQRLMAQAIGQLGTDDARAREMIIRSNLENQGLSIYTLRVGELVDSWRRCPFLRSLEFSWAVVDRKLVVGTDDELVKQLVESVRLDGGAKSLPRGALPGAIAQRLESAEAVDQMMVVRPAMFSGMIDSWMAYVEAEHAAMLEPEWWSRLRRRQMADRAQLGVLPTQRSLPGMVEVGQTMPNYPAHGALLPGDLIVAVDGEPLSRDEPAESLRRLVAGRMRPGSVVLTVQREARTVEVKLMMDADPLLASGMSTAELLTTASSLLRPFHSGGYVVWHTSPREINLQAEITLAPEPTTRPATRPGT